MVTINPTPKPCRHCGGPVLEYTVPDGRLGGGYPVQTHTVRECRKPCDVSQSFGGAGVAI